MIGHLIFYIFFILSNLSFYICKFSKKKKVIGNAVILIVFSGLRSIDTGIDLKTYKAIFEASANHSMSFYIFQVHDSMPMYRLICKLVYTFFNGNYQWMILISSILIVYGLCKYIYYYSDNCTLSVIYYITLFYFYSSWNLVRQSIAVSFFFLSIIELDRKKYKKFFLLSLMCIFTHNIVALLYIFIIFRMIVWNKIKLIIYTFSLFAGTLFLNLCIRLFIWIFPTYEKYADVLSGDYSLFGKGGLGRGRRIILSLVFFIFILIAMFFISESNFNKIKNINNKTYKFGNDLWSLIAISLIEIVLGIVFPKNTFYNRIQSIFSIFVIFMIPAIVERLSKKWKMSIYVFSNLFFAATMIVRVLNNESGVFPYKFF